MQHGSLFSGIGGFDLAADWMGWENIFHCEINEFSQKVLKHHFPKAISYNDITKTDFTIHRGNIDILTGGFPCQPYSTAGKRLGKADERHLFPQMLRAIKEIQPRWVVGENVRGLVSWNGGMVFHEVYDDLEREGYEVQSFLIPAASVNAPHQRYRVWFVAKNAKCDGWRSSQWKKKSSKWEQWNFSARNNERLQTNDDEVGAFTNSNGIGGIQIKRRRNGKSNWFNQIGKKHDVANSKSERHESLNKDRAAIVPAQKEKVLHGRGSDSFYQPSTWQNFPTQPPICGRDDGIPRELDSISFSKWRNESIKAYGNAIVPQVVFQIFKAIEIYG